MAMAMANLSSSTHAHPHPHHRHYLSAPGSCTSILHLHLPCVRLTISSQSRLSGVHGIPLHLYTPYEGILCRFSIEAGKDRARDREKKDITTKTEESHGFLRKKLAVFVSDASSTFQIIHQASMENKIYGDISVVVSDKPDCKACDYAMRNNISVIEYPKIKAVDNGISPTELVASLRQQEIDFILLVGYLKLLPRELVHAYPRAILNIHPALFPAFGGNGYYDSNVHKTVIKSGAKYSGPNIHFVDEENNHGVILAQRLVCVLPDDTADDLAARVLQEEHDLYPEVVAALCEDRILWRDDGVPLIRRSWQGSEFY